MTKEKHPGGRPTKYTPELLAKAAEYIENYEDAGDEIPSIAGLAVVLKVRRETLHVWANEKGKEKFSFGGSGSAQGQLRHPLGLQFWGNEIYVLDSGNDRIQVFSLDGVFLREIRSGLANLKKPTAMAINSKGMIFVVDPTTRRIVLFDAKGKEQNPILQI